MKYRITLTVLWLGMFVRCFGSDSITVPLTSVGLVLSVPAKEWSYPVEPVPAYSDTRTEFSFVKEGKGTSLIVQANKRQGPKAVSDGELEAALKDSLGDSVNDPSVHRRTITFAGHRCLTLWAFDGAANVAVGFYVFGTGDYIFCLSMLSGAETSPFEDPELKAMLGSFRIVPQSAPQPLAKPASDHGK